MHQDVAFLVRAADRKEAFDEAKDVSEIVKKSGSSYDGFALEEAEPYDSEKGKSVLQRIFGLQTLDFNDHLNGLRKLLTEHPLKTDAELMEVSDIYYHCAKIGDEHGSGVMVFGPEADGVQDRDHLKNIVDDWPSLVEAGKHHKSSDPLWVVWGDGHY